MCEYHFQQKRMVQSYSTPCSKTKFNGKTESYQLTIDGKGKKPVDDKDKKPVGDKDKKPVGGKVTKPVDDKDKKPVDKPAIKYKWVSNGPKTQCNTAAGEVFLTSSPGKGTSLEQCKAKCKDTPKCASITFNKNGWCSHYSTPCSKTK